MGFICSRRDMCGGGYRIQVRRKTSNTRQFLKFAAEELEVAKCPKGCMSPDGYNRYLKVTLAKMHVRKIASQQ